MDEETVSQLLVNLPYVTSNNNIPKVLTNYSTYLTCVKAQTKGAVWSGREMIGVLKLEIIAASLIFHLCLRAEGVRARIIKYPSHTHISICSRYPLLHLVY